MMLPEFLSQKEKEKFFHTLNGEQKIDVLNEIIEESKHIVFLGGAGVSTESGIADFRSKAGLYNKKDCKLRRYKPEYLLSYDCLDKNRRYFSPISEKIWIVEFYSLMTRIRNCRKWREGTAGWNCHSEYRWTASEGG